MTMNNASRILFLHCSKILRVRSSISQKSLLFVNIARVRLLDPPIERTTRCGERGPYLLTGVIITDGPKLSKRISPENKSYDHE